MDYVAYASYGFTVCFVNRTTDGVAREMETELRRPPWTAE